MILLATPSINKHIFQNLLMKINMLLKKATSTHIKLWLLYREHLINTF